MIASYDAIILHAGRADTVASFNTYRLHATEFYVHTYAKLIQVSSRIINIRNIVNLQILID